MEAQANVQPVSVEDFKKRTVRSWYVDGVWDLALAVFFAITGVWIYPWVITQGFPSWTWSWPFKTTEVLNPMHDQITLWAFGMLVIWVAYILIANWLANIVKHRFVAPRIGEAKFQAFLPIRRRVGILFAVLYILGSAVLAYGFYLVKGGPHLFAVFLITAPAGILLLMGLDYHLPRYTAVAITGFLLATAAELLTTNAAFDLGPRNLLDVSPFYGNPSIACLIWAVIFLIAGAWVFANLMRLPHAES